MPLKKSLILAAFAVLSLVPVHAADDRERVLRKLDAAAKNFHNTAAEFEFDTVTTEPIPDKDVQKGVVYYERKGSAFSMGVHNREENGRPVPKIYVIAGGVFKLYEPKLNQVTVSNKISKYEGYLALGFGASGSELEQKWNIRYLGAETLDGVKTDKLEMIAKDPEVRKLFPKVTIWVDTERGVCLKQVMDQGGGAYRVSVYFHIKVNQPLPADAFSFKTDKKTTVVNR
jgi:outer membrane lipoprotein-sorting protein